jgi:hypothetical protein
MAPRFRAIRFHGRVHQADYRLIAVTAVTAEKHRALKLLADTQIIVMDGETA